VSGPVQLTCTNFDKLVIFFKDGTYKAINIPEKQYFEGVVYAGVADKKTVMSVVFKQKSSQHVFAKRFVVEKFILDKPYRYFDEEAELEHLSDQENTSIELQFVSTKTPKMSYSLKEVPVKGVQTKGQCIVKQKVKKVQVKT
jgi:topoisomerase-4 subunit A